MPKIDTEKLEAYAQIIFDRENQFTKNTFKTIARRIKATGQLSANDQEALKNIADISGDMDKITKELARLTQQNVDDIEKIYAQVVNDGVNSYKPLYDLKGMEFVPITQNDRAMKLVRHWATLTAEKMINLSHTKAIGFTDASGVFTNIEGAYQRVIDDAVAAVSTGTSDFNSAMAKTIEDLGGSGVVTNYGSGVTRSLEAMVRQNLLWGAKQAAQSYDDYIADELGCDGFEVDAHAGCRPSHEFMQGKMFSYNGDKVVDRVLYQDGAEALERLEDYNCLHFKTGVILGVSQPTYSQEELDRIHKETTELIEYNGRKKTLYEWKQTQRRFEREYRKAQTQSDMFKESGNNIKAKDFKDRADGFKKAYDEMTAKVPGLYNHSDRMRTYFKGTNPLTSGNSSGIIEERRNIASRNMANGLRKPPTYILSEKEVDAIKIDIRAIGADESIFKFNVGSRTCYDDVLNEIRIRGDVLPDNTSLHPRDLMSARAVIAHEYYGHRAYRGTKLLHGSWNDEFRASYMAAKNAPNLSAEDRRYLILDALERAKEAGISIKTNDFIRRVLYENYN